MNLFQLVLKQMRQRALGTWLTLLSVVLGVALATAVLLVRRGSEQLFGQTEYGYDVLVGPRGSPLQLTINTVYHLDQSPGNVQYALYEALANPRHPQAKLAVPYAVGDTYKGRRIVATLPKLFGYADDGGGTKLPPERVLEYRPGRKYELAQGRVFHPEKFEAVVGADAARATGLKLGSKFAATHGTPAEGQQEHVHEHEWTVVGVMAPTGTANDNVLFIPLVSFYAISGHKEGLEAHQNLRERMGAPAGARPAAPGRPAPAPAPPPAPAKAPAPTAPKEQHDHGHDHDDDHGHDHAKEGAAAKVPGATGGAASGAATQGAKATDGHDHGHDAHGGEGHAGEDAHDHPEGFHVHGDGIIHLDLPKEAWEVSAVLVKARGGFQAQQLMYMLNNSPVPVMAVNPASVMREFFDTFLRGSTLLLLAVSALVTVVAGVSILVSIYNSVSARKKEIAVLRALGATRAKVLALICLEAALIGFVGGVVGLVMGHVAAGIGSGFFRQTLGEGINWLNPDAWEWVYLGGVVVIATLAGLVPAMKAYRTPVATNLVAG